MTTKRMTKDEQAAFIKLVAPAIEMCWSQIASDACALGRVSNAGAIELCIDADRLDVYGGKHGKEANAAIDKACDTYGYGAVQSLLRRNIRLV